MSAARHWPHSCERGGRQQEAPDAHAGAGHQTLGLPQTRAPRRAAGDALRLAEASPCWRTQEARKSRRVPRHLSKGRALGRARSTRLCGTMGVPEPPQGEGEIVWGGKRLDAMAHASIQIERILSPPAPLSLYSYNESTTQHDRLRQRHQRLAIRPCLQTKILLGKTWLIHRHVRAIAIHLDGSSDGSVNVHLSLQCLLEYMYDLRVLTIWSKWVAVVVWVARMPTAHSRAHFEAGTAA